MWYSLADLEGAGGGGEPPTPPFQTQAYIVYCFEENKQLNSTQLNSTQLEEKRMNNLT